jgi:flagellar hook-length control protein FliK
VETLFRDILADESLLSEVMAKLKEALPEEVFAQIEEMVEIGNELPLAAIFSPESPLFNQGIANLQEGMKPDGGQLPPVMTSLLKAGENSQKPNVNTDSKALGNLGRNISEALSQISTKGEGLGKQIQDLLAAVKAEFPAQDNAAKLVVPKSFGSDGTITPSTALGTTISGLAQLPNTQVNSSLSTPAPITASMGSEAWGQAMGDRIMWMVGKGVQAASIRINPPHLGPIQVQLSVQNDQTNVQMLVQHGAVKEALDTAIPRLREMLNESNLQLVNVDVNHRETSDRSSSFAMFGEDQREQMEQFINDQEVTVQSEEEIPRYYLSTALIDDYA